MSSPHRRNAFSDEEEHQYEVLQHLGDETDDEDDDTNDDDDTDDDDTNDDEEEEGGEDERGAREYIEVPDSPGVCQNENDEKENQRRLEGGGGGDAVCSTSGSQEDGFWNRGETEGLSCLICMEPWTNGGEHHICCLPCGHLYGFSCIKKWLQQRRSSGKCPQCNRKCSVKDVRKIFASRIAAVDGESHKRILYLEAKLSSLEKKEAGWGKKEAEWRKVEAELRSEVNQLRKSIVSMENMMKNGQRKTCVASQEQCIPGRNICQDPYGQAPSCNFRPQGELQVSGARLFDIDATRQVLLLARRLSGMGGTYVLTRMSLISPHETDDYPLPSTTKAIKDLHVSPNNDGLAVVGSLGKKLSVISMESHHTVLSYDLPAAAWSCSWDVNSSHHVYAGLQNGMVLVFDTRQTMGPLASLTGLTSNPVHTIHCLSINSTPTSSSVSSLLSASSIGLCQWNIGGTDERPSLVSGTGISGVCISSSYCPDSDHVVASFRPRVELSDESFSTQPSMAAFGVNSHFVQGTFLCLKRTCVDAYQTLSSTYAFVDNIRLPKTRILDLGEKKQLFASCDESTHEVTLQELSSFDVTQRVNLASYPLQDVKYRKVLGQGLLGLLSEDRVQLLRSGSL
ncbi:PREDICTED: E3 ubiquitin-protein ligase RFWD3 [Tarenaya hassleriana]|uniref:E3 ubiquitin-protein ligase RFWD3 n=1 Tax=Tarenaya hassleriana TaxID=28532 RepID=UPI00053C7E5E|nr:PREDICTED: E3 ubiquitin-protein ligase RFWD3 [Tarenaya hassleriana]